MANVLYSVPYEIRAEAKDTASAKPISNVFHVVSGNDSAPPAYGTPIAGGGSTATLLASFKSLYEANMVAQLTTKFVMVQYIMRSILGWRYGSTQYPITSVSPGVTSSIVTTGASTFAINDIVSITGVTGTTAVNGIFTVTGTAPGTVIIPANSTGQIWTGGGKIQKATGQPQLLYGSEEVALSSSAGAQAFDSAPLFSTASTRRYTAFAGKSWVAKTSFSCISEDDISNGTFQVAAAIAWNVALAAMVTGPFPNGGTSITGSQNSYLATVSRKLAFARATPFTASGDFCAFVQKWLLRPDMGSLLRRKPKLNAPITP